MDGLELLLLERESLRILGNSSVQEYYGTDRNETNENDTFFSELPAEMREMSSSAKISVLIYSVIWVIAAAGNLTVFASCYRQYKKHRSRITLLILHLSIADLIVTFCLIPIEISWRITIQWYGGNILCKVCQFLRAFGLYLSSMVLICVSFDRFFAILFPLKFAQGKHRVKVMLGLAWIASLIFSTPQAIFFSVETHPKYTTFRQCVTSTFLSTQEDVRLYSIFSVSAMYFAPLLVIIFTYTAILLKIIRKTRSHQSPTEAYGKRTGNLANGNSHTNLENGSSPSITTFPSQNNNSTRRPPFSLTPSPNAMTSKMSFRSKGAAASSPHNLDISSSSVIIPDGESMEGRGQGPLPRTMSVKSNGRKTQVVLRMSTNATSNITRAKSRTLRLTIVIVLVFVLCWTPYVVMTLWYMLDWATAQRVDPRIQDALFMMAVANSCVNPLVYGSFTKNCCGLSNSRKLNKSKSQRGKRPTTIKEALESQASHHS